MFPNDRKNSWLDTAVSGIRFSPDRAAVRAELSAHIEDKTADLRRIFPDIPPQEARDRALAGMGDAEEIKKELARVHKPWLGWLWRVSQAAAALAILIFVLLLVRERVWLGSLGGWVQQYGDRDYQYAVDELVYLEPSRERVEINGYTISMTEAVRWTTRPDDLERCFPRLTITLRRSSPQFWTKGGSWEYWVSAVDSAGTRYPSNKMLRTEEWREWQGVPEQVMANPGGSGIFHEDYTFTVKLTDPDVEWVRLEYGQMDRCFSFTVDLKGAGT